MTSTKDYTYYTKGIWIEKKQRAYQAWLSYLLSPTSAANPGSLNSKRLYAKVRGSVAKVYHKDPVVQTAMLKVEASISNGRLKLLTDGGLMVNPRMKKKAAKTLLSYDPFWLKLGLETVFRMKISPPQQGESSLVSTVEEDALQLKAQIVSFIEEQFFSVPELKKKLKKNVKRRTAVMEEFAAVVLKRFLLLVVLLDRTVTTAELPDSLPLLFDPNAKIKSSADMVRIFLKGSLFGEGDTVKQLEYMGYYLAYQQGVVNEFDYRTSNLALDFRDGIRSCKLAELLLGTPVLRRANFNTSSNAVKVYNVKLALTTFTEQDKAVSLLQGKSIHPQDIVDGLGETTVGYLWNIALLFQIPKLVTVSALVFEIIQVKIRNRSSVVVDTSKICFPTGYDMRLALLLTWVQTVVSQYGATAKNYRSSFADGSVLCYLVCHYLPSYMQPEAVYLAYTEAPIKEQISHTPTTPSASEEEDIDSDDEDMDLKQFGVYSGKGWMDKKTFKKHKTGILQNFNAVFSVMRALGGIPETISALDFEEQGPDETAVILYVSYMCARLLQVSREERAALTIQRMWKIYKGYADPIELIELEAAERKAKPKKKVKESRGSTGSNFTAFEYHRRQYSASRTSSGSGTCFSGFDSTYLYMEPKDLETLVKLQARARGALVRRHYLRLKRAVQTLEKHQPMIKDRCQYLREHKKVHDAATVIRAQYLRHQYSKAFQQQRAAAIVIQSYWRRYSTQKNYLAMKEAVADLKAKMQELKEKEAAEKAERAAIDIQSAWRGYQARCDYLETQAAVIMIQSAFRGYSTRRELQTMTEAAVLIQSTYRMHLAQSKLREILSAVVILQSWFRMWEQRQAFQEQKRAAIVIQAAYRSYHERTQYLAQRSAAICIQSQFRMHQAKKQLEAILSAVVIIQRWFRMWQQRRAFQEQKQAAVIIQRDYRASHCRRNFLAWQRAALCIQAAFRMHSARVQYQSMRAAAITLQAQWRSYVARRQFQDQQSAVQTIQAAVRMHQCRRSFLAQRSAAVEIQRWYRSLIQTEERKQQRAAIKIQSIWKAHNQFQLYQKTRQAVVIIQRAVRLHQKRIWLEDVESRLSTILVDFVSAMERTHDVVKATIIIQAYMRGALVRKHNPMTPSEIRNQAHERLAVKKIAMAWRGHQLRKKVEKENKAIAVLQDWLPTIRERCQFLKKRKAANVIQEGWRNYQKRREDAAMVIQRAFRATKENRRVRRVDAAATKIQSAWKGYKTRVEAPREVKKAVSRLRSAEKRAKEDPSKSLRSKCLEAVETVKNNTNVEQTFVALASLEMGTMYSQRCCEDLISSEALIPLLRVMAKCNRSADHQTAFLRGLTILKHLCKYKGLAMKVFRAAECLDTLSERLQYYRDCPVIFAEITALFRSMLKISRHKRELAENTRVMKQWNSLWSLLARKVDTERKYINKLEADKASDRSAKRATEKAYVASHQLVELGDLFDMLAVEPVDFAKYASQMMSPEVEDKGSAKKKKKKKVQIEDLSYDDWRYEAIAWKPKNTIAKEKLTQLRTVGLPTEPAPPTGVPNGGYVAPRDRRRLRVLSTDDQAVALEERTKVRLMSDYRRPPRRGESVGPSQLRSEDPKRNSIKRGSKINRSTSVAPNSRIPRVGERIPEV